MIADSSTVQTLYDQQNINRSDNIPNFGGNVGDLNPQSGYNLVCVVSPETHNTVFIGGTNLFRSKNGFGSPVNSSNDPDIWIGGYAYANNVSGYNNHHPDQHNLIFDPNNPNEPNFAVKIVAYPKRENYEYI